MKFLYFHPSISAVIDRTLVTCLLRSSYNTAFFSIGRTAVRYSLLDGLYDRPSYVIVF
jgi:hypothetical protein